MSERVEMVRLVDDHTLDLCHSLANAQRPPPLAIRCVHSICAAQTACADLAGLPCGGAPDRGWRPRPREQQAAHGVQLEVECPEEGTAQHLNWRRQQPDIPIDEGKIE